MDESGISPHPLQRVFDKLNAGLSQRLTLIVAPAGSGKMTLLRDWLSTSHKAGKQPVAWLALQAADNDPARFLRDIIAALEEIELESLPNLPEHQPNEPETAITDLTNALSSVPFDFTLILEDYHLITAEPIHQMIRLWLDYPPPQMHLVIASQEEPPLQIAQLRARRQLVEIEMVA